MEPATVATPPTTIHFTLSRANNGQWGYDTTPEDAELLARNAASLTLSYAQQRYPDAEVQVGVNSDYMEERIVGGPAELALPVISYVNRWWVEPQLMREDFDAARFLRAHPTAED